MARNAIGIAEIECLGGVVIDEAIHYEGQVESMNAGRVPARITKRHVETQIAGAANRRQFLRCKDRRRPDRNRAVHGVLGGTPGKRTKTPEVERT